MGKTVSSPKKSAAAGSLTVRRARAGDVPAICGLINAYAAQSLLLPRSPEEIASQLPHFRVCLSPSGKLLGCCALQRYSDVLAEIRSLAVVRESHGRGVGSALVRHCLRAARRQGLRKVFALTYSVEFFGKVGFAVVDKETLPDKIWKDCANCSRRLHCRETAMAVEYPPASK